MELEVSVIICTHNPKRYYFETVLDDLKISNITVR